MINTERLILRSFIETDEEDVFDYINTQTIHCFEDMRFTSLEEAKKEVIRRKEEEPEYYLAICLKDTSTVIGEICSHTEQTQPNTSNPDTHFPCWMLHPDYQGKGYAYEAAYAYYNFLFREKNVRRIYTYTEDYNFSCQKLCEKLGMRKEGLFKQFVSFVNNPDGTPLYENTFQYAILKDEWESRDKSRREENMNFQL